MRSREQMLARLTRDRIGMLRDGNNYHYENMKRKKYPVRWAGPVLAGDRLIVVASTGEAISLSPYTGQALGRTEFPDSIFLDPIVADDTLYVLTDEADLIALK